MGILSATMSIAEKIELSLSTSLLGMGTVFAILILLWGVLELFRVLFAGTGNKKKTVTPPSNTAPASAGVNDLSVQSTQTENEEELVAIFTAAIAMMTGKSASSFTVRSFSRVKESLPAWNQASRLDQVNNLL